MKRTFLLILMLLLIPAAVFAQTGSAALGATAQAGRMASMSRSLLRMIIFNSFAGG